MSISFLGLSSSPLLWGPKRYVCIISTCGVCFFLTISIIGANLLYNISASFVSVSPTEISKPFTLPIKLPAKFISIGAQNCHYSQNHGPFTGSINTDLIKSIGAKYVIIGHSENRVLGDTNNIINLKIKSALKKKLKIIFCIGETLLQRKRKQTHKILKNQISKGLQGVKKLNKVLFAYEPVWSIGTGIVPKAKDLEKNVSFIRNNLLKKFRLKNPKILYGGSVNPKNVKNFKEINIINGFLVGAASQNPKKFIDIVKKTFN